VLRIVRFELDGKETSAAEFAARFGTFKAYAICGQGVLRIVRFELDGKEMSAAEFAARFGTQKFEFNC